MSFSLRCRSSSRASLIALGIVACLMCDASGARQAPQIRRVAAPRAAMDNRAARQAERAQQRAPLRPPQQERAPEAAPVPVEPAAQARPGRLTPDERRALRQQINDAGREIYRPDRP